ncbi:MAG TPA: SDR family oxidoreductase [Tepidisphaeraceae bacterium]
MSDRPVAMITGGAKRVGAAIARRLAKAGFDIAVTYLSSATDAEELLAEIRQGGVEAIAIRANFNEPWEFVPRISAEVLEKFGRLDLLMNNASVYRPSDLQNTDKKIIDEMMNVHFVSPLLLCRDFEKELRRNHGLVVNMVDATAEKPGGNYLAYTASKAALANLTLAMAGYLAPEVRVNGIAPGVVEWPPDFPQQQRDEYLKRVPLQRSGTPEDVAELVMYLATNGKYITGQILKLDGGRSIV